MSRVDPREIEEIIQFYTYYPEQSEEVKQADILRFAHECRRLRLLIETLNEMNSKRDIKAYLKEELEKDKKKRI